MSSSKNTKNIDDKCKTFFDSCYMFFDRDAEIDDENKQIVKGILNSLRKNTPIEENKSDLHKNLFETRRLIKDIHGNEYKVRFTYDYKQTFRVRKVKLLFFDVFSFPDNKNYFVKFDGKSIGGQKCPICKEPNCTVSVNLKLGEIHFVANCKTHSKESVNETEIRKEILELCNKP